MRTIHCSKCGGEMQVPEGQAPRLCPYCGKSLLETSENKAASELETRLAQERNPKKKFKMIQEALSANPDSFEANRALLYHGRLHEPMRGRDVDFSIIKSYLLHVLEKPDAYSPNELDAKYEELLNGSQLRKTMALAPDGDAFFTEYLRYLAQDYIDLFIRGDSRNSRMVFGFSRSVESTAKLCGDVVSGMLVTLQASERIHDDQRRILRQAILDGFSATFPGYLDKVRVL